MPARPTCGSPSLAISAARSAARYWFTGTCADRRGLVLVEHLDPQGAGPHARHCDDVGQLHRRAAEILDAGQLRQLAAPEFAQLQARAPEVRAGEVAAVKAHGLELGVKEVRLAQPAFFKGHTLEVGGAERGEIYPAALEGDVAQRR